MARKLNWTVQGLRPQAVIEPVITAVAAEAPGRWPVSITTHAHDSNDRAEVRFDDGRTRVVKRARHAWARERFAASRAAAALLHEAGIPARRPLAVPAGADRLPVEAYWKVELPTLTEVWVSADRSRRTALLRDWGRLARRIHRIRLPGDGPLLCPHPAGLGANLRDDLAHRLLPAVAGTWPEAHGLVETLADAAERIASRRVAGASPRLILNDLRAANVLCSADGAGCVGALDLEAAFAGPAEADLAHAEVLHGPLFGKPLPAGWLDEVLRGYGRRLDPVVTAFFRGFHLASLGFHAALRGFAGHAADVLAAARDDEREVRRASAVGRKCAPVARNGNGTCARASHLRRRGSRLAAASAGAGAAEFLASARSARCGGNSVRSVSFLAPSLRERIAGPRRAPSGRGADEPRPTGSAKGELG